MITKHLVISGRVQGVGYRASFYYAAKRLGVNGWVRNRRDGTVEACVSGSPELIEELIEWARTGPELSRVAGVSISECADVHSDFSIRDSL